MCQINSNKSGTDIWVILKRLEILMVMYYQLIYSTVFSYSWLTHTSFSTNVSFNKTISDITGSIKTIGYVFICHIRGIIWYQHLKSGSAISWGRSTGAWSIPVEIKQSNSGLRAMQAKSDNWKSAIPAKSKQSGFRRCGRRLETTVSRSGDGKDAGTTGKSRIRKQTGEVGRFPRLAEWGTGWIARPGGSRRWRDQ